LNCDVEVIADELLVL